MRWMILVLGLFLSGCYAHYQGRYQAEGPAPMLSTSMAQVNAMVGVQQPSGYKVGFMEGCDSGRLSAGNNSFLFKKDTNRFDTDDVYKQGWNDGFNRCVSGEGAPAASNTSYYQSSYSYYNPGTFYSGFYYPNYYYAPGFSIWTGSYYGYPRHRHVHRHNHYYTPWYGGHKHKGHRHRSPWLAKRGGGHKHRGHNHGNPWLVKQGGGHKHKGGGGQKGWSGKGGRSKGGGGTARSPWLR